MHDVMHAPRVAVVAASAAEIAGRVVVSIVLAIITTVISLRLLGMRRGWTAALLAGVVGWLAAGLLALALADWDWGADGLVLFVVAIGIPATMAAAVSFDLVARPGSLALGERAGLVVAPRLVRSARRRVAVLRRYRQLLRLAREQGFGPMASGGAGAATADDVGVRLRRVLEQAGGVYIKLGQIAATRVDIVPSDIATELASLQNRVAPEPIDRIREVLEQELGGDVATTFAEFDWNPLAAGSIGQTHCARLHTGEAVVVKVQRPDIAEVMERDLAALALLADVAQRRTAIGQGLRSGEMLAQFATSLRAELDFRLEADATNEMALVLGQSSSPVRIPRIYADLCTRRLLVQERFDGFTAADGNELRASGIDRERLADQLLRSSLDQVLRIGFFHADPHPGNVFVFRDGTLGLIDFGAVGRLDPIQQAAVVDMLAAIVRHDVSLLRDAIERVAELAETVSPERLERALARLMADHVRATGTVDPSVLQDLVATLSRFGVRLPGDLIVLSRALVTLDGTLRVLHPGIALVPAATAVLTATDDTALVDRDQLIRDELLAALPQLRHLPDRLDRILTQTSRGDLRVRTVVDEDERRILRTLVNRVLLAAIGSVLLGASAVLLASTDAGPSVAGGAGLFEVFGYGGLFGGVVLVLRVVAAVARDGTT